MIPISTIPIKFSEVPTGFLTAVSYIFILLYFYSKFQDSDFNQQPPLRHLRLILCFPEQLPDHRSPSPTRFHTYPQTGFLSPLSGKSPFHLFPKIHTGRWSRVVLTRPGR